METAKYGRMDVGRCVIKDYGYVGCNADVMEHMDNKCSGRRTCEIRIPDTTLDRVNPCPKDFKTFLKAGYTCIEGVVDNSISLASFIDRLDITFPLNIFSFVEIEIQMCGVYT